MAELRKVRDYTGTKSERVEIRLSPPEKRRWQRYADDHHVSLPHAVCAAMEMLIAADTDAAAD